jgi:hypothetical protein
VVVGGFLLHKDNEVVEENFDYTNVKQTVVSNLPVAHHHLKQVV